MNRFNFKFECYRTYNLRSQNKPTKESDENENFQPKAFKIVLKKLDPPKISPKKTYPRLNIDTQKSPKSNSARSSQNDVDVNPEAPKLSVHRLTTESSEESQTRNKPSASSVPESSSKESSKPKDNKGLLNCKEPILLIPRLPNELSNKSSFLESRTRNEFVSSFTESSSKNTHKLADNSSLEKSDKKIYPQLEISIKKSPKSSQKLISNEALPSRRVSNSYGLKKRKINFGICEGESSKSKDIIQDANLISPKWKKSLKKRKKDDTSFKIGTSFSLLEFRKSKKTQDVEKSCERVASIDISSNSGEMNSQGYSLRITGTECSNISANVMEKSNEKNESTEMEALQISEDEDVNAEMENNRKLATSRSSDLPLMESDDESFLAVPLESSQNDEIKLETNSSPKLSNFSAVRCPVLRLPRIDPDSLSFSFCESSSIKLNISESIVDCVKSQLQSIENSNSTTSKLEKNTDSDSKHEPSNANTVPEPQLNENAESSMSEFVKKMVRESKNELMEKIALHSTCQSNTTPSQNKPKSIKVPKKPATKKKSLGMRMRKNIKQSTSYSKSKQDTSEALLKTNDGEQSMEKLPMTLVEDGQKETRNRNLATSLDSYCDSNIELQMSCTLDSSSKNSSNEVKTYKNETNRNVSNSANSNDAICDKNIQKVATKLTSPPCFEDSQLELDIFKFCSQSVEDLTKESCNDQNLPTVSINESSSSSILNDSEAANNRVTSIFEKPEENKNLDSSPSFFSNKSNVFLSDSAIDDDVIYSQEIAFEENLIASQFNDDLPIGSNFLNLPTTSYTENDLFCSQGVSSLQKSNAALPKQLIDDNDTYFSQVDSTEPSNNLNANLVTSPSFFDDEFLYASALKLSDSPSKPNCFSKTSRTAEISQNLAIDVDDDSNVSCSNDSLLNVIDSLTPRTKEALNRKLNSFVDDMPTSISQQKDIFDDLLNSAALNEEPSASTSKDGSITGNLETSPKPKNTENETRNDSKQSKSLEESSSPNILDKSSYSLNIYPTSSKSTRGPAHEEILFEEDSFDSEFPVLSDLCENEPVKKAPTLDNVLLNNSIWDSVDSDESTQEDNEIQSFYHNETINPAHITIIRDIAEDNDSSPIAKSLTPESQTSNEILSFYGSQSPDSMICSISQDLVKSAEPKSSTPTIEASVSGITKRAAAGSSSPFDPHSTPSGSSTSTKKTPSPLYTPILKKLMIKKVNEKDKRRVSSQRFRAEPFLPEIEEETESKGKESDKNTTLSLPVNISSFLINIYFKISII